MERDARPERVMEWLARLGYASRGLVYLVIGVLAVMTAAGAGGGTTDPEGALVAIQGQPLGTAMVAVLALGLFGFMVWRLVQAVHDPDGHGHGAKGLAIRGGLAISGVVSLLLAGTAASMAFGWGGGGGGDSARDWTAWLMSQPFGRWAVAAVGLGLVGAAVVTIGKAWRCTFLRYVRLDGDTARWAVPVCRFGLAARGVAFALVAWFLLSAAWEARSGEARGLGAALHSLLEQPFGPWLLGLVALGLVAFGIYNWILARFRQIGPLPDPRAAAARAARHLQPAS